MNKPRLGALVVGQSPRHDIVAEIEAATGGAVAVELRGALDGLTRDEVAALAPLDDVDTLFTRLPDGSGAKLSKRGVVREGTRQLEQLADGGYDVTMVLCTGEFPEWAGRFRVVFPSRVLRAAVAGLQPHGRLGVFIPLPEQVADAAVRWRAAGYDVAVVALSPNADGPAAAEAARALAATPPDLLVFDCMSYTSIIKHAACRTLGVPGVLAISCCARLAAELVS